MTTNPPAAARRPVSPRLWNMLGFLACLAGMMYALYAQYFLHLEPCPLCIFQRIALIALGTVFIIATLHDPQGWGSRVYALLILLVAGAGAAIAARHAWLQSLPPEQVPACGPGLDYLWQNFPIADLLNTVFRGSGECAKIDWELFHLSMPWWTLFMFVGLGLAGFVRNLLGTR